MSCGIVGYVGKETKIRSVFNLAYQNKHRGDDDGFGYYDFTNKRMVKSILELDEINNNSISCARDDKKGTFKRRLTQMKKEMNVKTKFILFHHRKASSGGVVTSNTHPIKIRKDVYYCQNGSVGSYGLLKRYFRIYDNMKYHTDTDTEVICKFMEKIYRKGDAVEAYKKAVGLFQWIGVVIRMDLENNELLIFKDTDRTLFVYENHEGYLMISEPLPSIKDFGKCYRLDWGIFKLDKDGFKSVVGKMKEVGDRIRHFIKRANGTFKCDDCDVDNNRTIRAYGNKDFCLGCITKARNWNKATGKNVKNDNISYANNSFITQRYIGNKMVKVKSSYEKGVLYEEVVG